jgi:hypothetical protein
VEEGFEDNIMGVGTCNIHLLKFVHWQVYQCVVLFYGYFISEYQDQISNLVCRAVSGGCTSREAGWGLASAS